MIFEKRENNDKFFDCEIMPEPIPPLYDLDKITNAVYYEFNQNMPEKYIIPEYIIPARQNGKKEFQEGLQEYIAAKVLYEAAKMLYESAEMKMNSLWGKYAVEVQSDDER